MIWIGLRHTRREIAVRKRAGGPPVHRECDWQRGRNSAGKCIPLCERWARAGDGWSQTVEATRLQVTREAWRAMQAQEAAFEPPALHPQ